MIQERGPDTDDAEASASDGSHRPTGHGPTDGRGAEPETEPDTAAESDTAAAPDSEAASDSGAAPDGDRSAPRRPGRLARFRGAAAQLIDGRRWPGLRVAVFALVGAVVAVAVFGHVPATVGPFETTLSARPSVTGHTVVHLAPLGTIDLDTHDWPVTLDLRLDEIGVAEAERIADDPDAIDRLGVDAADEVRSALVGLAVRCALAALIGGVAGALAARLSWRTAAAGAAVGLLLVATVGLGAAATFEPNAVSEPRYTGLLARAPTAVGDIERVLDRFGEYRAQLSDLVDNMATLYLAGSELPTFDPDSGMTRVLHVSDIHLNPQAFDMMARLTEQFGIDVIADTGDLTDWGSDPEAQLLSEIGDLGVPYVYVRGNHDSRRTQEAVAAQPNAVVLDGGAATVAGLRFWGIGDPRYTPDKSDQGGGTEQERAEAFAPVVADRLAADEPPAVDVAMVHDRRMALDIGGEVPLVLAGHTHEAAVGAIEPRDDEGADSGDDDEDPGDDAASASTDDTDGRPEETDGTEQTDDTGDDGDGPPDETLLLEEGSTGGAGLRGLQGEEPEPLTASVLYFDRETRTLVAYDRITVAWLGDAGATIDRHIVSGATTARAP